MTIRAATADDLGDVVAAYNAGIQERVATFETALRTLGDLADWLHDGQPFVLAEQTGRVLGWARAGSYSDRCVYQGVGEHAVYVHPDGRGQGLARQLLIELCAESERRGLYKLTSRVSPTTCPVAPPTEPPASRRSASSAATASSTAPGRTASLSERLLGETAPHTEA